MVTDLITFKADRKFIKKVDKYVNSAGFHNRTEFIRDALRLKMSEVEKENAIKALRKLKGSLKGVVKEPTEEEYERYREEAVNTPLEEKKKQLDNFLRSLRDTNI